MKNNKRGFTLVELLVVIAIMGLLSIMVFPSVSKLIKQNKDKQFEYYKETLLAAAKIYYNQKEPDLAFEEWTGCIEISYDDLLKANLLSPMSKDYNCSTSKVRITKNSNETYQVYLTCTDNDGKLVYNKGGSPSGVCNPEPVEHSYVLSDVLIDEDKRGSGCKVTSKVDYTDVGFDIYHDYLTGNCQNNYVWYHGNLYRAYEIRSAKGVFNILMFSQQTMAVMPYSKSFVTSFMEEYRGQYEGVLNTNEYEQVKAYFGTNVGKYLVINYDAPYDYLIENCNGSSCSRQAVTTGDMVNIRLTTTVNYGLAEASYVVAGNGSKDNPYRLSSDNTIEAYSKLNTRYNGEYVKLDNELYRIVETNGNSGTKLVRVKGISTKLSFDNRDFLASNLGKTLINSVITNNNRALVNESGQWYDGVVEAGSLNYSDIKKHSFTSSVGMAHLGELFASPFEETTSQLIYTLTLAKTTDNYRWLLDMKTNTFPFQINDNKVAYMYPMIWLKPEVIITGGNGTKANPFKVAIH